MLLQPHAKQKKNLVQTNSRYSIHYPTEFQYLRRHPFRRHYYRRVEWSVVSSRDGRLASHQFYQPRLHSGHSLHYLLLSVVLFPPFLDRPGLHTSPSYLPHAVSLVQIVPLPCDTLTADAAATTTNLAEGLMRTCGSW